MAKRDFSKIDGLKIIHAMFTRIKNISVTLSIGIIMFSTSILVISPQESYSQSFSPAVNLSNDSDPSRDPVVVKSGNKVYIVWEDGDIFFKRSTDNGATFETTKNLSNDPGFNAKVKMAASGNNVYMVWEGERSTGSRDVFLVRSTDGGKNFHSPLNLSNNAGDTENPRVKRSDNSGKSFGATINLSNNHKQSSGSNVLSSGNSVYVLWRDQTPGNFEIFFRASDNKGASFDDAVNISENSGVSTSQDMSRKGNNVYVVWEDDTSGNDEILFKKGSD